MSLYSSEIPVHKPVQEEVKNDVQDRFLEDLTLIARVEPVSSEINPIVLSCLKEKFNQK